MGKTQPARLEWVAWSCDDAGLDGFVAAAPNRAAARDPFEILVAQRVDIDLLEFRDLLFDLRQLLFSVLLFHVNLSVRMSLSARG